MKKILTSYEKFPLNTIVCMGDSITQNYVWGVKVFNYYPAKLQELLENDGKSVLVRNFGVSGNTTTQMVARQSAMYQYGTPKITIIYGGINDGTNYTTMRDNLISMATLMIGKGSKVILVYRHYNNYSTGGDTTLLDTTTRRTYYEEAYNSLLTSFPNDVAYCDLYGYMRNLIDTSVYTQGDWASWHVADSNVHLNDNGELIVANALLQTIQSKSWDDLL